MSHHKMSKYQSHRYIGLPLIDINRNNNKSSLLKNPFGIPTLELYVRFKCGCVDLLSDEITSTSIASFLWNSCMDRLSGGVLRDTRGK